MFRFIFVFLIFVCSALVGIYLTKEPGYALLSFQTYTIEMPLWLLVLFFICTYFLFNMLFRAFGIFGRIYYFIPNLLSRRKRKLASKNTIRGMIEIIEGKWKQAEKHLLKSVNHSSSPMLNYLSAAKTAQEQGDMKKRDSYIDLAYQACENDDLAVRFTQIELYLQNHEIELALASLEGILICEPENRYAVKLLHDIYLEIHDWGALLLLLPKIKQLQIISTDEIYQTELLTNCNILRELLDNDSLKDYMAIYSKLSRDIKSSEDIIIVHSKYLVKIGEVEHAEKILIKKLKNNWSDHVIETYGNIISKTPDKQLKVAENYLRKHDNSAYLHTSLARISSRNKLWSKAKSHYEESLHLNPSSKIYAELGDLLNIMEEYELSIECYKKGIEIVGS